MKQVYIENNEVHSEANYIMLAKDKRGNFKVVETFDTENEIARFFATGKKR